MKAAQPLDKDSNTRKGQSRKQKPHEPVVIPLHDPNIVSTQLSRSQTSFLSAGQANPDSSRLNRKGAVTAVHNTQTLYGQGSEIMYVKLQESLAQTGDINHPDTQKAEKKYIMTLSINEMWNYHNLKSRIYMPKNLQKQTAFHEGDQKKQQIYPFSNPVLPAKDIKKGETPKIKNSISNIVTKSNAPFFYETDGHYSTVYLVSLMLGMNPAKAKELATATEAPDTTIHNEIKFELNDTWGYFDGSQQNLHSLTGGFHGIEEFFTAIKFLYAPKENTKLQGEMLHRFGDTYAHSKIGNLKPSDMKDNIDLKNADDTTVKKYIESWKQIGSETTLGSEVRPWIKFFNYYLEKDGFEFLDNEKKQKEIFKGKTLKETLKDLYFTNKSSSFEMYGKDGFTGEHFLTDKGYPDQIYLRPEWYYIYVQNLSWLISTKYGLDNSKLDLKVFDKMITFLKKYSDRKPSLKGIIDYEIAKKLNKKTFYVPVFYASGDRFLAALDANVLTNYLQVAENVVSTTKNYLIEQGISASDINVEEIKEFQSNGPEDMPINIVVAYKITIN